MKGILSIDDTIIGAAELKIVDRSMGAIGGDLIPNAAYERFRLLIQVFTVNKGIANIADFNFKIILLDHTHVFADGGIGVTDLPGFEKYFRGSGRYRP